MQHAFSSRSTGYSFVGLAETDDPATGTATTTGTTGTATTTAAPTWKEQAAQISLDVKCIPPEERTKIIWVAAGVCLLLICLCFWIGREMKSCPQQQQVVEMVGGMGD